MERKAIDGRVRSRFWERIEEFEQKSDEAGLAAAGPSTDGNFRAGVDGQLDVAEGEGGSDDGSVSSNGVTPGEH